MRWEMVPEFAPILEAVLLAPARTIKESPAKLVTACAVGGRTYYLKRYRHDTHPLRPLKFFWKRSQACQEWGLARDLTARGIPVVAHVAVGERWGWTGLRESILITEAFPGEPVEARTESEAQDVLAFLSGMHQAGVIQHDLHGANLLRDPRTREMRLVDLYGIEVKNRIAQPEKDRNLAVLRITLPVPVTPAVAALSCRLRKKTLAKRSKRAWKQNREFMPKRFGKLLWQVRLPLRAAVVENILQDPDGFLASRAQLLKAGRSATVAAAHGYVLKRYNLRRPLNPLKDLARRSRAYRALRKAYHLELTGIATARPVAAATRTRLGLPAASYFLMEEISGATSWENYRGNMRRAVACAASLLARMHAEGFSHRDLKLTNLLLDREGQVYLIDLEGLRFRGDISATRAGKDLGRLWRSARAERAIGRSQLLGFLKHYCRERGIRARRLFPDRTRVR